MTSQIEALKEKAKKKAEKKANSINKVLKDTGAEAKIEFARNYNNRGKDWGVVIIGFTTNVYDKLEFKIKEE